MLYREVGLTMIKWISKNQGLVVALVINMVVAVWLLGCESKVQSLTKEQKVTRSELTIEYNSEIRRLESEIKNLTETAEIRYAELDRLDELKSKLLDALSVATNSGTFNATGLVTLLGTITAIGLGVDNRIKDKVIKNRPLVEVTRVTENS